MSWWQVLAICGVLIAIASDITQGLKDIALAILNIKLGGK